MIFKTLDLFCGAGGLAEGFRQAGYEINCAVELDYNYLESFKHNHKEAKIIQADLHYLEPLSLLNKCGLEPEDIDIIIGGPPCKGFSMSARGRWTPENWLEDNRNHLIFRFAKYVDYIKPPMFLMENVLGLRSRGKGKAIRELTRQFEKAGYNCKYEVLNSADYGDPQIRKRIIFIGRRDGRSPEFPEPTHSGNLGQSTLTSLNNQLKPWVTVKEALLSIDFSKYPNHKLSNHKEFMVERMKKLEPGKSLYESYKESWYRLILDKPSPTVKENHNAPFVHPTEPRVVTVRECATLQGFPLTYEFKGPKSIQLKQVGNAVPVNLARALALKIKEQLEDMHECKEINQSVSNKSL